MKRILFPPLPVSLWPPFLQLCSKRSISIVAANGATSHSSGKTRTPLPAHTPHFQPPARTPGHLPPDSYLKPLDSHGGRSLCPRGVKQKGQPSRVFMLSVSHSSMELVCMINMGLVLYQSVF